MRQATRGLRQCAGRIAALLLVAVATISGPAVAHAPPGVAMPADGASYRLRLLNLRDASASEDRRTTVTQQVRRLADDSVEISFASGTNRGRVVAPVPFLALPPDVVLDAAPLRHLMAGRVGDRAAFVAASTPAAGGTAVHFAGQVVVSDRRTIQTPLGAVEVVDYVSDTRVSGVTPRGDPFQRTEILRRSIVPALGITVRVETATEFGASTSRGIGFVESIDLPPTTVARSPFEPGRRVEFMPPLWEADALAAVFACRFEVGLERRLGRHCTALQLPSPRGGQHVWRIEIEESDSGDVQRVALVARSDPTAPRPPLDLAQRFGQHYGFAANAIAQAYARPSRTVIDATEFTLTLASGLVIERRR